LAGHVQSASGAGAKSPAFAWPRRWFDLVHPMDGLKSLELDLLLICWARRQVRHSAPPPGKKQPLLSVFACFGAVDVFFENYRGDLVARCASNENEPSHLVAGSSAGPERAGRIRLTLACGGASFLLQRLLFEIPLGDAKESRWQMRRRPTGPLCRSLLCFFFERTAQGFFLAEIDGFFLCSANRLNCLPPPPLPLVAPKTSSACCLWALNPNLKRLFFFPWDFPGGESAHRTAFFLFFFFFFLFFFFFFFFFFIFFFFFFFFLFFGRPSLHPWCQRPASLPLFREQGHPLSQETPFFGGIFPVSVPTVDP